MKQRMNQIKITHTFAIYTNKVKKRQNMLHFKPKNTFKLEIVLEITPGELPHLNWTSHNSPALSPIFH